MLSQLLLYATELLALATAVAVVAGFKVKPALGWTVAVAGGLSFALLTFLQFPPGKDVQIFWDTGRTLWEGGNPYAAKCLNPPTAFPLYLALGALPFSAALILWTVLNVAGCLALVAFAQRTLQVQDEDSGWKLPPLILCILTSAAALSFAVRYGIELGQIAILNTAFLFAALYAQGRGRPVWAGFWLALATIKISLMLPFLLLFHRKSDRPAWISMIATSLVLCLFCTSGMEMPSRLRGCLAKIAEFSSPGKINDYSYLNSNNIENFGFDHALYRVGVKDRQAVQAAQLAFLVLLGCWIGWHVVRGDWSPAASCAMVAFYSSVFLYHRVYDMTILYLPLVYAAGRARTERGVVRWLFVSTALVVLGVLYLRVGVLRDLTGMVAAEEGGGLGYRVLEALVLPYGTWLVIFGMFCLAAAERLLREPAGARFALAKARLLPPRAA